MSEKAVDNLLRQLRDELTIDPSADFAARARARVAETRIERWHLKFWVPAAASVAAVGIVLAFGSWRSHVPVPTGTNAGPIVAKPAAGVPARRVGPQTQTDTKASVVQSAKPALRITRRDRRYVDLQVITSQPAVLWQIRAELMRTKATLDESSETSLPTAADPQAALAVAPLTVEPITVRELNKTSGGGGPPAPAVRRAVTEDADRSRE